MKPTIALFTALLLAPLAGMAAAESEVPIEIRKKVVKAKKE